MSNVRDFNGFIKNVKYITLNAVPEYIIQINIHGNKKYVRSILINLCDLLQNGQNNLSTNKKIPSFTM